MKYTKKDFELIITEMEKRLCQDIDDPLPCRLYDFKMLKNRDKAKMKDGSFVDHVPDACNLASSIQGIYSLLTLVKNDDESERLSRVLIRELGALREAVQNAMEEQFSFEKNVLELQGPKGFSAEPPEKNIRLWADVLKHPAATILAHQCFSGTEGAEETIDTTKLRQLEKNAQELCRSDPCVERNMSKAWNKVWIDFAGKTVQFQLPTVEEITEFIAVSANRLEGLIDRRQTIETI